MEAVNTSASGHEGRIIIQSNKMQVAMKMILWMQTQPNWNTAPDAYKVDLLGIVEMANSDKMFIEFEETTRNQKEFFGRVYGQYLNGKLDFLKHEKLDY